MKTLLVVAVLLAALIQSTSHAQAQGVMVEGQVDCGLWVKARTDQRSVSLEHFVLGLLDGLAMGHNVEFWRAHGSNVSRDSVFLWIDNYCHANPLKSAIEATAELYTEQSGWSPPKR